MSIFGLKARVLVPQDITQVLDVFCRGNAADDYYRDMFPGDAAIQELRNYYEDDIAFALKFPYCFGVFGSKGRLQAQLLAYSVDAYLNMFPGRLEHLLAAPTPEVQAWNNYMIDYFKGENHPNIHCFDFQYDKEFKDNRQKLFKLCIEEMLKMYGKDYIIASDHSDERICKWWEPYGFQTKMVGTVWMSVRPAGGK